MGRHCKLGLAILNGREFTPLFMPAHTMFEGAVTVRGLAGGRVPGFSLSSRPRSCLPFIFLE
jgi:hypothetical protein